MLDSTTPPASPSPNPSFRRALAYWLKLGFISFGGPAGQITLIMVVGFVGFVGGWSRALFGPDSLLLAGAVAASVITFFTCLPSFCFIFPGGPFIESTHGQLKFSAPLTAITAAIAGVIVNLAVFFAQQVLWPDGLGGASSGCRR